MIDSVIIKSLISYIEKGSILNGGIYWETYNFSNNIYSANPSLYSGVSGLSMLYIRLYELSGNDNYLSTAINSAEWCFEEFERQKGYRSSNYSIYTGHGGIAFLLLTLFDFTKEDKYINRALDILSISNESFGSNNSDLLLGHSGTLLSLLHAYVRIPDDRILKLINDILIRILDLTLVFKSGFSINFNYHDKHPLCGLSHGASGVGYALVECYRIFENKNLLDYAKLYFSYENHFYSKVKKNWPDFRYLYPSEGVVSKVEDFDKVKYMNAWCHGAIGILISRINLYKLTGVCEDRSLIIEAGQNILETDISTNLYTDYTICHGLSGILLLVNELLYFEELKEIAIKKISEILLHIERQWEEHNFFRSGYPNSTNSDYSLFMGIAGIIYSMVSASSSYKYNTVVNPRINDFQVNLAKKKEVKLNISPVSGLFWKNIFIYLNICLNSNEQFKIYLLPIMNAIVYENNIYEFIKLVLVQVKSSRSKILINVTKIDIEIFERMNMVDNWHKVLSEDVTYNKYSTYDKQKSTYKLRSNFITFYCPIDLEKDSNNIISKYYYLVRFEPNKRFIKKISYLAYTILKLCQNEISYDALVYKIQTKKYFIKKNINPETLQEFINKQLNVFIENNIIQTK